jgi:adenylate cyclase class IV
MCIELGASDHGVIEQRDTYFGTSQGRLKLREEIPGRSHLIQYERGDSPAARLSSYRIAPVEDPASLTSVLSAALGRRGVVAKRRHLFLWQDVRIHLDDVTALGAFIEFEAVAPDSSDLSHEHEAVSYLCSFFQIHDHDIEAAGYADLLGLDRA